MHPRQGLAQPFPTSAEQNMLQPFCPMKRGWAIASELPEASSLKPQVPAAIHCRAPASPGSLPAPSTHFIALLLHTWVLPRAPLDLSKGKKPLIPWGAPSVLSVIASGNLRGTTGATFLLTASLLTLQRCSSWEAWPRRPQPEPCPRCDAAGSRLVDLCRCIGQG